MDKFPAPVSPEELKVLIIDNQGLVHDQIISALRDSGVKHISSAFNAFHAVRLCKQHTFDMVMLAFNVSNDKDGFHLFEELRQHQFITDRTSVIFLSAETSHELVNCIVELQPDDFWVKPLDSRRIAARLTYLLAVRKKLNKLLHCLYQRDYAAAMYHAQRQLNDDTISELHPRLRRIVGECLLHLRDYPEAERYFTGLLNSLNHAWVHINLVKSLLRQNKQEEAQDRIENLLERRDTRFLTLDLLAQFHLEHEQYAEAYEKIKQASSLAPRNIERHKRLWDLARLNHDKTGQLVAVQNMARYAKNSIHDSPELQMNVIRSTLDLATSVSQAEAEKLLQRAEQDLVRVSETKGVAGQLDEQVRITRARMLCLQSRKKEAEVIMKEEKPDISSASMEDNLDKMKAFHELGMKEHCLAVLDKLRQQIEGDTFSSQVVDEYLKQEEIERREIQFTTKELKEMAAVNYRENRMLPAYNNLRQALRLSPDNRQLALSLLKVMAQLISTQPLNNEQEQTLNSAARLLLHSDLPAAQREKRNHYFALLQIDVAALGEAPGLQAG